MFICYGLVCSVFRSVRGVIPCSSAMDWCVLCSVPDTRNVVL